MKGRNLARSPHVVVHLESGDETVILEGEVEVVRDVEVLEPVADAYEAKYGHRPSGLCVLRPRLAKTWLENDYTRTATRWLFD